MALKDKLYDVPVVGTALRVQDRYKDDDADQYAGSIGFFGFLSIFPLLLISVAVAGFVLAGDEQAQRDLVQTALDAIPGISAALGGGGASEAAQESQLDTLVNNLVENAGTIGGIGLVTLILSGLRVVNAGMRATARVFRVEVEMAGWKVKLRQIGAILSLGLLALAGVAATSALGVAVNVDVTSASAVVLSIVGVLLSIALDFALFMTAYRVLAAGKGPGFKRLWPGGLLSAIAWTGLKAFGATYVSGQVSKANDLYGVFGGVIALLLLFYLAGRIYLYGAELSGVLYEPGLDLAAHDDEVEFEGDPHEAAADAESRSTAPEDATAAAAPGGPDERDRGGATATRDPDLSSVGAGSEAFPRDPDQDVARITPRAHEPSPTISAMSRQKVETYDRIRSGQKADVRGAIAFVLALGAVGGLVKFFKPWETDED